jgi:rhomboid family GlyGly-CTERM serine protease
VVERGGRAWVALAVLMLAGSLAAWPLPSALIDWQPDRAFGEPWRLFSAAFVHWSEGHLAANAGAAVVVAALGVVARLPVPAAGAWLAAWPLTHLGLLARPELAHYGGLSGVLHAGVAVAVTWLVVQERGARRAVGAMVALGLVVKLVLERPFGPVLQMAPGWDIALAPVAHATGTIAGFACAAVAWMWHQNRRR